MKQRLIMMGLMAVVLTSCFHASRVKVITNDLVKPPASKAMLSFINQAGIDISLNIYTGYDQLPGTSSHHNRDNYQTTLNYYERSQGLYNKQALELKGLQKRAITYPPYMIASEVQKLANSFMQERSEWKHRYPLPPFYHQIVNQVRSRSFHAGIFPSTDEPISVIDLELPTNRTVLIFIKEGKQSTVKELTHFVPQQGKQYRLHYTMERGQTALKQNNAKIAYSYGVIKLYEVDDHGQLHLISSTDPNAPLLDHPERFNFLQYDLLLKVLEQLISATQIDENDGSMLALETE